MLAQEKVAAGFGAPTITSRTFEGTIVITAFPVCVCGGGCMCEGVRACVSSRQLTLHCDCSTTDNKELTVSAF